VRFWAPHWSELLVLEAGSTALWAVPALCHVSRIQRSPGLILGDVTVPVDTPACGQHLAGEPDPNPSPPAW